MEPLLWPVSVCSTELCGLFAWARQKHAADRGRFNFQMKRGKKAIRSRARARAWYAANRERAKARIAKWQKDNPEKVAANRLLHREQILRGQRRAYRARAEYYIAQAKEWAKENAPKRRSIGRKWARKNRLERVGLSKQHRKELLCIQKNRCAICQGKPRRLCLDHDHATGFFRGFLCQGCNAGLGMFQDRPAILRLAASFLEAMR